MSIFNTICAVVGFVVVAVVTAVVIIKVTAKHGHHAIKAAKVANKHVSNVIRLAA